MTQSWVFWAVLSAAFAALTAIFAKIGVAGINSDFATLIRTVVILAIISAIVLASGQWQPFSSISAAMAGEVTLPATPRRTSPRGNSAK